jgi:gallidermin/nisin family lantibiotic
MPVVTEQPEDLEYTDPFDLDVKVFGEPMSPVAGPAITSRFLCTPGCTSPGGGSFCSYCC